MTVQKIIEVLDALLTYPKQPCPLPIITDLVAIADTACHRPETAAGLPAALASLPDPRVGRGVRHQLTVVVSAAVCAVVAGYRSYTAIAEWVADVPASTVAPAGHPRCRPPAMKAAVIRTLMILVPVGQSGAGSGGRADVD